VLAKLVDEADVRMIGGGSGTRLTLHAIEGGGIADELGGRAHQPSLFRRRRQLLNNRRT